MSELIHGSSVNQTELWLHSRLTGESRWENAGIASSFTVDKLADIADIFSSLDSKIKLKLLLSFLELSKRVIEPLIDELNAIIQLATEDNDDWVRITALSIKPFPNEGCLNENVNAVIETVSEIKEKIKQVSTGTITLDSVPLDFSYLNRTIISKYKIAVPMKHFTLKRKPKSAALRAQLTQKEGQRRTVSTSGPTTPINRRASVDLGRDQAKTPHGSGPTNLSRTPNSASSHPMSRLSAGSNTPNFRSGARASIGKKTKLLDITEQPIGREAKKRRKITELDMAMAAEDTKSKKAQADDKSIADDPEAKTFPAQTKKEKDTNASAVENTVPSYAVLPQTMLNTPSVLTTPQVPNVAKTTTASKRKPAAAKVPRSATAALSRDPKQIAPPLLKSTDQVTHPQSATKQKTVANRKASELPLPSKLQQKPLELIRPPSLETTQKQPQVPAAAVPQPSASGALKKGLSLTKEQMIAAQEIFRSANCVTKPEKALILGFMAGARENPFPHRGPVITIKLSETTEDARVTGPSGPTQETVLVEMLFEMNYQTGQWRRLKRTRTLAAAQQQFNA